MAMTGVAVRDDGETGLITRAQRGDRDAFALLIVSRSDRVLRMARAILGNEAEAHDAAQNALVSAWVNLPRLRDVDKFDAWINRVLRNECNDTLRRRGRSREIDLATVEAAAPAEAMIPDASSGTLETASVKAAFGRLSVDDRTILLLHHLHGLPLDEVARQLAVPVGTAKSRLWSARRALERALEAEA
jgi:RNA polymerase sigma-70 factor (ECF subfamily)